MATSIAQTIGVTLLILAAYWLPGAALRDLVAWRGLGRLGHLLFPRPLALIGVPLLFNTTAPPETGAVSLLLPLVAALATLPRLHLLLRGSDVSTTVISDIYWHLSELTSIASSGLPPPQYLCAASP